MRNLSNSLISFASLVAFAPETGAGSGSADPLADLGLDLGTETSTDTVVSGDGDGAVETTATGENTGDTVVAADETAEKKTRQQVQVGDVQFEEVDLIPSIKRGGGGGKGESKYDFDKLSAPVAKEEGEGYRYSTFTVANVEGQDFKALQRSVQSAATAQNREHKAQGSVVRFITRTKVTDGAATGVIVFRVDNTIDEEA